MKPEVRYLSGFALIAVGAAGLVGMNVWTVPELPKGRDGCQEPTGSEQRAVVSATVEQAVSAEAPVPRLQEMADAGAVIGDAEADVMRQEITSWTTVPDGTELPSIRFEPQSQVLSAEMSRNVEPIAAYLRNHFGMKVVLVGHGDEGMDAAEYVQLGRRRSSAVLRMLVDLGVTVARIGIEPPNVEEGRIVTKGIPPGAMELRIEPRFVQPKKGDNDGP
ncbi:MAG TPA: OmpA family protein [Polyangiaceae bacterium]|jgi:outer membrane protein OmpA-like peptidoglycan-associated protein|nr:MAG: OmpA family protein [Deltaproteobacteria bacterium ADurb.Bin207]HNZ23926.1 OmpA family protein [Polyangiaceae bacterium]HOD23339.1 OmpA family protein [Polyangiaceae bacterium]HOR35682.1 OmpA family protein [Polyangiaceae bacterium]HOT10690.1 OmpA family protein [Polyangiaceae bacterium]